MIDHYATIIQAIANYVADNGAWIWRKMPRIGSAVEARRFILGRLQETDPGLFTDYAVCLSPCELRRETWDSIDRLPELAGRPRIEDGDLIC